MTRVKVTLEKYPSGSARPRGREDHSIETYAPHEAFHHLFEASLNLDEGTTFRKALLGDSTFADLDVFWQNRLGQEWAKTHPLQQHREHWHTSIPIVWHLDGARFANSGEAFCWILDGVLGVFDKITCMQYGPFLCQH